ncbi:MAG: DUF4241 domain-containing protein, partial [Clostridiales bacterium]|nr:DUF4241 domain-containing protein [Clostridiales bacterium]
PFTERLPAGDYEAFMLLAPTDKGKRVAFAGLDGGELATATQWLSAFCDERDVLKLLSHEDTAGIEIGSGLGALCGEETFCAFAREVRRNSEAFHPLDGAVRMDGSTAQMCRIKDLQLPVCSTGWGEGNYRCYYGIGADGTYKGILCDFALLPARHKRSGNETVEVELDVNESDHYIVDPDKSDAENSILQNTAILSDGSASGAERLRAYARRGYSYHTAGRYAEALADYLQAIELGKLPENSADFLSQAWSLYDNAALIYRETGRTAQAVALYREAKNISDTFYSGAYAGLIDIYRDNKEYLAALAIADEMVAARPQDPAAYIKRSEIYMESEEYEKAIVDLTTLIEKFKLSECILDKAVCLRLAGKPKEALSVLDSYLLDGRANEIYYNVRVGIDLADNNFAAAYIDARNAYDVNPDSPQTLERLIELDGLLLHFKNVVKWASRYIELRPQSEYGYSVRAEANVHLGEYADAVADYLRLVQSDKADAKYYALLIRAALLGGSKGIAKKYRKILRQSDNAYYIYSLGLTLFFQRKNVRALRYLELAAALHEVDIVLSALISAYLEIGEYEKAEQVM